MYSVCIYTLLKVVRYYDLSVFPWVSKKKFGWGGGWGVVGWCEFYPSLFWIFQFFLTLQRPLLYV